jgi:tetratricopeptide (TPR) repeat protein
MLQQMPVVRQIDWSQLIPQVIAIAVLTVIIHLLVVSLEIPTAVALAALVYLIFCRIMRALFAREQSAGIADYRAGRFPDAIKHFETSHRFFSQHPWLDAFRSLLFGVAGPNPYRIIALCNIAYCYSQLGDGARAIEIYKQVLSESPGCTLARASLNMLRSTSSLSDAARNDL